MGMAAESIMVLILRSLKSMAVLSFPARSEIARDLAALLLDAFVSIWWISVVNRSCSIWYSCLVIHNVRILVLTQAITLEFSFVSYPITAFLTVFLLAWEICCLSWDLFPPRKLSGTFARWVIEAGSSTGTGVTTGNGICCSGGNLFSLTLLARVPAFPMKCKTWPFVLSNSIQRQFQSVWSHFTVAQLSFTPLKCINQIHFLQSVS